jgi:hypothetical protein
MNSDINLHRQLFVIRFLFQLYCFHSSYSPLIKITLIFLSDLIDSEIYRWKYPNVTLSADNTYERFDKINDLFGYVLAYHIILNSNILSLKECQLLSIALVYRLIGTVVVFYTGNQSYYVPFVDMFKEIFFLFLYVKSSFMRWIVGGIILYYKIQLEYKFHVVYHKSE